LQPTARPAGQPDRRLPGGQGAEEFARHLQQQRGREAHASLCAHFVSGRRVAAAQHSCDCGRHVLF